MTSPGSGVFQYQQGGQSAADPNAGFPNINPRSQSTGSLLLPQDRSPQPPHQAVAADAADGVDTSVPQPSPLNKNNALQSLMINSINDPESTTSLQEKLIQAGYLSPKSRSFVPGSVTQDDATFFAVNNLFDDSIRTGVPFQQILDKKVADHPKAAEANYAYYLNKFGSGGSGSGLGSTTTKDRTVSQSTLSSVTDAQGALTQAMRDHVGRAPTKGEVAAFQQALNAMQSSNPVVRQSQVVTDTPPSAGGSYAYPQIYEKNATQSGGIDPSVAAQNFVQGNMQQEADQHGVVGYVNAFESLLKGG